MIKIYRYLSGIYHFFDSFGKCGKKVVLVWYWIFIVLIVWEEVAGGRSHRKPMRTVCKIYHNAPVLRKIALKLANLHYNLKFAICVACGTLLRRIETTFMAVFEGLGDV